MQYLAGVVRKYTGQEQLHVALSKRLIQGTNQTKALQTELLHDFFMSRKGGNDQLVQ